MSGTERSLREWQEIAAREPGALLFEGNAEREDEARSLLFRAPVEVLEAWTAEEVDEVLRRIEAARGEGFWVAGMLGYEAGLGWQGVRAREERPAMPLARFGVYREPAVMAGLEAGESDGDGASLPLCLEMEMEGAAYGRAVERALAYIAAGDTYQVNLTTAVSTGFDGDAVALYRALRRQQPAAFGALLHWRSEREGRGDGAVAEQVLSFSPELFFRIEAGPERRIVTRPMKGTAALPEGEAERAAAAAALQADEKNRAENIMIVDLLRNDLGRVCAAGSVAVERLFEVERYRTLLQMTSTVSGRLRAEVGLGEVLRSLFPSGSMTGAPKRRTMEVIAELEPRPRGVYSGALGFAAPDGSAVFSVAIRTAVLRGTELRMGVGGGVVADSTAAGERDECWLKAGFLLRAAEPYRLFETMRWDGRYHWVDEHMERLATSADALGFRCDVPAVQAAMEAMEAELHDACRVKVMLERDGRVRLERSAVTLWSGPARVQLSPERRWSGDRFLRHKTTMRAVYDREHARAISEGWDDALFLNERGELTEGAVTSLLVRMGGRWVTPRVESGVLPGVARGVLLRTGQVVEDDVPMEALRTAEAVALANGVRGVAAVALAEMGEMGELRFPADVPLPVMPEERPA